MTIQLNTIIDRPITDARHFTSTLIGELNVAHAWSLIQSKAYADPTSSVGGLKIPSRLPGGVPLKSWSATPAHLWESRGGFEVSAFAPETANNGFDTWTAEIPNPGPVFSIIAISKQPAGFRELFGIDYANMNAHLIPDKNARSMNMSNTSGTLAGTYDMGPKAPWNEWFTSAWVFDFTNAEIASAINGGDFAALSVPAMEVQPDATVKIAVGRGYAVSFSNQNYSDGSISDIIILTGDVRNSPAFLSQIETYNATGYAV